MSAAQYVGGKGWIVRVLCVALLCGSVACATAGRPKAGSDAAALSDVRVEERGEMTVVTLQGVGQPVFATREEGSRLVVDVSGVSPKGVPDEIALVEGAVEAVEVAAMVDPAGAPFTRVQIALAHAVEYDVAAESGDLEVRLVPVGQGATAFQDRPAGIAGRELASGAGDDPEQAFTTGAPPAAPAPEASPARILEAIEVQPEGAGTRVHLVADGRIGDAEAFAMQDPTRLVIDIPGVESRVGAPQAKGKGPHVARVRVGSHSDKVRVVLDGVGADAFTGHRLTPVGDGLVVDLGAAAAGPAPASPAPVADAAPAKSTPAADAAAATASTRVEHVSLAAKGQTARISITAEGVASYQLFEPADDTVVVSLPEAVLSPGAETRLAAEPGGPVSLVMAFQQPEVKRPEVRVVVTRAAGVRPAISRDGNVLVVTFDSSAQAELPAVLGGDGGAAAKARAQAGQPPAAVLDGEGLEVLKEGGLLDGKQYNGRRISLDFKDVEIDDVLRLIAEVSDLNIIAGDEVAGKVTIRLVDVPWDQALDVILLTKGLGFVKVGNVLRIAPQNLLQQESEARMQERRAKEKLEDLVVKFQPVNYASVTNVAKMLQRLLSPRGTVNTDERTNTVIIKDIPTVIDESVALIKAIDTPTPQVLIEAKIVEANLDFSRELGTVWGSGIQRYNDAWDDGSGDSQIRGVPDFRLHPDPRLLGGDGELNNFVIDNPISSLPTALVNLGAFLLDDQFNVELQLQAAESTGEGKVISSPRVVTLDNREAEIKQGVAIPYQTFENGDAQLQFVDAVLSLNVKPHITADKSIIMMLEVTRDAPDDSVATGSSGAPAIAKNQAKTETLVRDGQTLVIGGIYTIQKGERSSRVPYLWNVPFLGNLFKSTEVRDIRKELLIFVTPRIVEQPQIGA